MNINLYKIFGDKMAKRKTAEEMAKIINEIYEERFGGKGRGRFQIQRSIFRKLAGRKNLHDTFVVEVSEECADLGYILIPLGDIFAVIEENIMLSYRKVPKSVFSKYLIEDEYENETLDEEED